MSAETFDSIDYPDYRALYEHEKALIKDIAIGFANWLPEGRYVLEVSEQRTWPDEELFFHYMQIREQLKQQYNGKDTGSTR